MVGLHCCGQCRACDCAVDCYFDALFLLIGHSLVAANVVEAALTAKCAFSVCRLRRLNSESSAFASIRF